MEKILYVINSPSWTEIAPSGLNNSDMFDHELSENFTFFYYNLMKYGLVKKIIIFVESKRWRLDKKIKKTLNTKYGTLEIREDKNKFEVINSDMNYNFVYCWSNIEECQNIKNKFVIVDNQFHGYIKKSKVDKQIHDLVLTESKNFQKFIPTGIQSLVYKLISYDHENYILNNNINENIKTYDWLMISSFDKRKRHIEFLNHLKNNKLSNLRGCIIARDPDNKSKKLKDLFRLTPWKILSKVNKYKKKLNFDIFLNIHQNKKIELSLKSKVYVNTSILDSGPRAQVEVMQLNLPVLSMPHIGASDLIKEGENGEIAKNLGDIPLILKKMLDNYNHYSLNTFKNYLKSDLIMPDLVKSIKEIYKLKVNE